MSAPRIAIIYHSLEGQTIRIAEHIAERERARGVDVVVTSVESAPASFSSFDGIMIGGSVHAGKHSPELVSFVEKHLPDLQSTPNAFFSVSLAAVKTDETHHDQAMGVVNKFIDETGWHPDQVALIGGALAYTQYGFIKRQILKHIAKKEGASTDTSQDHSLTDWDAVDAFANDFFF